MALELECLMRTLCWFIDVPFKLDPKIGKRLTNSLRTNSILCEIYANHVPKAPPSNAIITLGVRCQHKQLYGGQEHWGHCNKERQRMQRLPQGHKATQVAQSGFKFKPSCVIALEQRKKWVLISSVPKFLVHLFLRNYKVSTSNFKKTPLCTGTTQTEIVFKTSNFNLDLQHPKTRTALIAALSTMFWHPAEGPSLEYTTVME